MFYCPCSHYTVTEDRLNVTKMKSSYGVSQLDMHPTKIKQGVGYLGPHDQILEAVYDQHMVFQEGVNVPLFVNPQYRVAMEFSQYGEP